jgi:hypothetical protein
MPSDEELTLLDSYRKELKECRADLTSAQERVRDLRRREGVLEGKIRLLTQGQLGLVP